MMRVFILKMWLLLFITSYSSSNNCVIDLYSIIKKKCSYKKEFIGCSISKFEKNDFTFIDQLKDEALFDLCANIYEIVNYVKYYKQIEKNGKKNDLILFTTNLYSQINIRNIEFRIGTIEIYGSSYVYVIAIKNIKEYYNECFYLNIINENTPKTEILNVCIRNLLIKKYKKYKYE